MIDILALAALLALTGAVGAAILGMIALARKRPGFAARSERLFMASTIAAGAMVLLVAVLSFLTMRSLAS